MMKRILLVVGSLTVLLMSALVITRVRRFGWQRGLKVWQTGPQNETTRIDFYERLLRALEKQGIKRELYQTPLEFASTVGVNEARAITNAYNRVRFGNDQLSDSDRTQIEGLLARPERSRKNN